MDLPNKPLYNVGDTLTSKTDIFMICKIETYNKGFLEKSYHYETFLVKREYSSKELETPFNEWNETEHWSEGDIYSGIRTKEYKLRKFNESEEASETQEAENPYQEQ